MPARRMFGLNHETVVSRDGIAWHLDLREGIDLAIYLLSVYDRVTVKAYRRILREGDVVLDIGANFGAHTLHMARAIGSTGRVYAFEPTDYAYAKLCKNIEHNPDLVSRIMTAQILLDDGLTHIKPPSVYASWPLGHTTGAHPAHGGCHKGTECATIVSLDSFVASAGLERLDFIKMDVDGNECRVLRGAKDTLAKHKPRMVLELAPYGLGQGSDSLESFLGQLDHVGYTLNDLRDLRPIPSDTAYIRRLVPDGAGINVLASPR